MTASVEVECITVVNMRLEKIRKQLIKREFEVAGSAANAAYCRGRYLETQVKKWDY